MNTGTVDLVVALRILLAEMEVMPAKAVSDDSSLFDAGILDSLRLMELVAQIQSRFGIRVGVNDLIPDHFDSLERMARYVSGKLDSPPP